ncbi:hypothetical protein PUN28_011586 [Cardiocondyla obscurior]|uniref:Large ribosomal subunit protein mL49 n=1 Tax=Cardiocondyla obscurior TaxID=286306 RepID=A0AAW2FH72_9HYME
MAALRFIARGNLAISASARPPTCAGTSRIVPPVHQIQQRWGSYRKGAPMYTTPEDYTDFEVTNDPNEWKYVERLFGYKVIPKPPTGNIELPSGYKPVFASSKENPYFIERTRNYMQPVFLNMNPRNNKKVTVIRKIQGNIWTLEQDIKQYVEKQLKKKFASQIHEFAGIIKFKGDCVSCVKEWMNMKGF